MGKDYTETLAKYRNQMKDNIAAREGQKNIAAMYEERRSHSMATCLQSQIVSEAGQMQQELAKQAKQAKQNIPASYEAGSSKKKKVQKKPDRKAISHLELATSSSPKRHTVESIVTVSKRGNAYMYHVKWLRSATTSTSKKDPLMKLTWERRSDFSKQSGVKAMCQQFDAAHPEAFQKKGKAVAPQVVVQKEQPVLEPSVDQDDTDSPSDEEEVSDTASDQADSDPDPLSDEGDSDPDSPLDEGDSETPSIESRQHSNDEGSDSEPLLTESDVEEHTPPPTVDSPTASTPTSTGDSPPKTPTARRRRNRRVQTPGPSPNKRPNQKPKTSQQNNSTAKSNLVNAYLFG
jgi:hypothetical protein